MWESERNLTLFRHHIFKALGMFQLIGQIIHPQKIPTLSVAVHPFFSTNSSVLVPNLVNNIHTCRHGFQCVLELHSLKCKWKQIVLFRHDDKWPPCGLVPCIRQDKCLGPLSESRQQESDLAFVRAKRWEFLLAAEMKRWLDSNICS